MASLDPAVLDVVAVEEWMAERVEELARPLEISQVAGGNSNLTFLLSERAGRRWVLRRPPTGHTLETAHDMAREYRAQAALQGSRVPVVPMVGLATDVLDVPFYVMDFVDGLIVRNAEDATSMLSVEVRRRVSENLVDGLVELHAIDPSAVGLERHGRPGGYLERQLHRWHRQWEMTPGRRPLAAIDEVHDELVRQMPEQSRSSIVHGDFRLDNTVVDEHGELLAVLDWELSTLGDPMADLGTMLAHWVDVGLGVLTSVEGFWTPEQVGADYVAKTGLDLALVDYYRAFAHWRLACICEGVFVRYRDGAMGGGEIELEDYGRLTAGHASLAQDLLGGSRATSTD